MPEDKLFTKLSLLTIFDNRADAESIVGAFQSVRRMVGLPPVEEVQTHTVTAWTKAYWCEELHAALVEQGIDITDGGAVQLVETHPLRDPDLPKMDTHRNIFRSSELTRMIVKQADEWIEMIGGYLPLHPDHWRVGARPHDVAPEQGELAAV